MKLVKIRKILKEEMKKALELVWKVFLEYEAPDYTEEGIKEFKKTIDDVSWIEARDFYGAYDESNKILGVIATKDVTHIALFFVDGKYHKQGIGKKLYYKVESLNNNEFFTVNSSPYAVPVYHKLGFVDTDTEQLSDDRNKYSSKKRMGSNFKLFWTEP